MSVCNLRLAGFRSSAGTVFAACLFHWKEESISEAELQVCIDDVKQLEKIKKVLQGDEGGGGGGGGAAMSSTLATPPPPPLQPGIPTSIANMMAAFNISPRELLTVRDRLIRQQMR